MTDRNEMPYLYYRGICSLDLGLYIRKGGKGSYYGASRSVDFEEIPGRNGDLIIDNKRYNNISVPYDFVLIEKDVRNFDELTHRVKSWLLSHVGYFELWDGYDKRYFRLGAYNDEVNIEEELRGLGEFSASFNCKPFKYSFDGQKMVNMTEAGSIVNPEYLPSAPYIRIYGSGNITLTINNDSFYFEDIEDYIEVDSESMNAYKGISPLNNKMKTANFPEFIPGDNAIAWTGSVNKIEIIPRWCAL